MLKLVLLFAFVALPATTQQRTAPAQTGSAAAAGVKANKPIFRNWTGNARVDQRLTQFVAIKPCDLGAAKTEIAQAIKNDPQKYLDSNGTLNASKLEALIEEMSKKYHCG